jgi:hypothetical protein
MEGQLAIRSLIAVATLGALSLAGVAAGQPLTPPLQVAPGLPITPESRQTHDDWLSAVHAYHLTCAGDRQVLCADKTSSAAQYRCLNYHRLKVNSPCKEALKGLAANGAGRSL